MAVSREQKPLWSGLVWSGALDVELQHMVFCTEFWMGAGLESR